MNTGRRKCFEGWYYKQQSGEHTLALIAGRSDEGAFIQAVTERNSWNIPVDLRDYRREGTRIRMGANEFSPEGVRLKLGELSGELRFRNLKPLQNDIMGPFRFFPMECRHGVDSMLHDVEGCISLNGNPLDFTGGKGYIEHDSGWSFPKDYWWVHCNDFAENCSIMASAARIPFAGTHFRGCIAAVWLDGREYRLATYLGAHIVRCEAAALTIRQGAYTLEITAKPGEGQPLAAPVCGEMRRIIRESAACPAHFRFTKKGLVIFDGRSARAGHEYVLEPRSSRSPGH